MFESVNLAALANIAQSVITPEVATGTKAWRVDSHQRHRLYHALFPRGKPGPDVEGASPEDQNALLSQFTACVASPLIEFLPPAIAPFAVLMLYEEFVKAVFIQSVLQVETGGEG
jgi:hypothetical protein